MASRWKPFVGPAGQMFDKAIGAYQRNQTRYPQSLAASKSGVPLAQAYIAKGPQAYPSAETALLRVIDDNPHKRGLYMPGSKLPIAGSPALLERDISLCLLSLNPIGEQKVIEKNSAFVERGGTFASIFPASARALTL